MRRLAEDDDDADAVLEGHMASMHQTGITVSGLIPLWWL
jgi:hypothetical protein